MEKWDVKSKNTLLRSSRIASYKYIFNILYIGCELLRNGERFKSTKMHKIRIITRGNI